MIVNLSILTQTFGLLLILFNIFLFIIIYFCVIKNWSYFSRNNVKFIRGPPILGAQWKLFLGKKSFPDVLKSLYDHFPTESIVGIFDMGGAPKYLIRDLDLIKQITIKDFDHFVNHPFELNADLDPIFGRSLVMLKDQQWRDMRSILSPAFTGSKMRLMYSLIGKVSHNFCENLKNDLQSNTDANIECDIKDLFTRFASDTIASTAFGLDINSLADRENEFYRTGLSASEFSPTTTLKIFAYIAIPKVAKMLQLKLFKHKDEQYFREIILQNMKYRQQNNIVRNDLINLLLEIKRDTASSSEQQKNTASKKSSIELTDDDMVSQCMAFFLAGFKSVAYTLCFIAHALAVHPEIQQKLYDEIRQINGDATDDKYSYDAINKMTYLDMVVSETMRLWGQGVLIDRKVNKPYLIGNSNGQKVQLNVGDVVIIPTHGIHMDSNIYTNPEQFDPERFSVENRTNMHGSTFMPFGNGPRSCIASRFATMECKVCIVEMLTNFQFVMCEKTQHPIQFKRKVRNSEAENGFWMKIKLREE